MSGQEMAGVWQGTMEYFLDVRERHLCKQYELWSTCVEEFGYRWTHWRFGLCAGFGWLFPHERHTYRHLGDDRVFRR